MVKAKPSMVKEMSHSSLMENVTSNPPAVARSRLWTMLRWFLLAEAMLLVLMAGAIVLTAVGLPSGECSRSESAALSWGTSEQPITRH
jgi:hypothetical protein